MIPYKNILILEPHIDDVELGCSVLFEYLEKGTTVVVVSFCYGYNEENSILRMEKRKANIKIWEEMGLKVIHKTFKDIRDTTMDSSKIDNYITELFSDYILNMSSFDLLLIPQKDLHNDHCVVNTIGNILSRQMRFSVWEYIILNSFPEEQHYEYTPKYNTQFSIGIGQRCDLDAVDRVLEVCEYKMEKSCDGKAIRRQKYRGENYLCDKFNIIKQDFRK